MEFADGSYSFRGGRTIRTRTSPTSAGLWLLPSSWANWADYFDPALLHRELVDRRGLSSRGMPPRDWHGSTFDVRTGRALSGPVRPDARLITLPTRVENGVLTYVYEERKAHE